MSRNRLFNALIATVIVALAGITVRQFAVASQVVSAEAGSGRLLARPEGGSAGSPVLGHAGRTDLPLDECFDLPLSEASSCHRSGNGAFRTAGARTRTPGEPLDVCFDVSLGEACDG